MITKVDNNIYSATIKPRTFFTKESLMDTVENFNNKENTIGELFKKGEKRPTLRKNKERFLSVENGFMTINNLELDDESMVVTFSLLDSNNCKDFDNSLDNYKIDYRGINYNNAETTSMELVTFDIIEK